MYFENPKKNYYRFPNKTSVNDFNAQIPYYFPTKNNFGTEAVTNSYQNTDYKDSSPNDQIIGSENNYT